ncbi:LysR family transcriptional regulator [Pseudomaricurvus alkylphenolicus]|jgi:LysR family transcriptional regulator of abg operon|uniref:LysR family transcriptional regulator n=1 Tax=Pseudomaricurvus alkylphenolicus TaxID=1306991 RepID=UPI00141D8533|nr:LysR family transcriptional regulator [Pseudomaricurvus alkylphenolicus]NIB43492.1 LysR family transcriptional regulator [Pseudomaricurvus alkylphenolicus]
MKFNQLEAFIATAEGNGVVGAAERLCLTQPAITKSISNLEEDLGAPLFDRSRNRLVLNRNGAILLRRAKAAKAELQRAREEIHLMSRYDKNSLKFNCSPALLPKLIPKAINLFKSSHPDTHVELAGLLEDDPKNKITALLDGEYDLLFTVLNENEGLLGVSYEKLMEIEVIFVASKGHPALQLQQPSLKELEEYDWLLPGQGGLPYQLIRAAFRRVNARIPHNALTIANRQITFSLLDQGSYLAAIPYHPSCFEQTLSELQVVAVNTERIHWPLYVIQRENTIVSQPTLEFIEQIKQLL